MNAQRTHQCPICAASGLKVWNRYPDYVCGSCANKVVSETGRKLRFYNDSLSGGFTAEYADTGEKRHSHDCYIDGILCHAGEARFGGIVIEAVKKQS